MEYVSRNSLHVDTQLLFSNARLSLNNRCTKRILAWRTKTTLRVLFAPFCTQHLLSYKIWIKTRESTFCVLLNIVLLTIPIWWAKTQNYNRININPYSAEYLLRPFDFLSQKSIEERSEPFFAFSQRGVFCTAVTVGYIGYPFAKCQINFLQLDYFSTFWYREKCRKFDAQGNQRFWRGSP